MPGGVLQARRIPTELGSRAPVQRAPGEPPSVIQTAMATKDKKPFTYLPGGIDLSEIKSPRMQKRIMMNARSDGVQGAPATAPAAAPAPVETTPAAAPPPPPPPPPPPAPAPVAPAAPAPPQRQAVPLASILTASTRQAQAQRPAMPPSPVAPQPPPPPPERAQSHRPQFRNDQGAQMAPSSPVKLTPQSPLAQPPPPQSPLVSPQPQSPQQQPQQPLRFATEPQRASPPSQQMRFAGDSQPPRDASPPNPAAERIAANPPWRVTKKPATPDSADGGATRGQGELYIRPVAAEAEPVQLRSAPLPWMSSSPTSAEPAPEFAAATQQIEAARLGRLGQPQSQPQSPASQPQSPASQPQSPMAQAGSPQPRFIRPQMPQAQAMRPQMVPLQSQLSQEGPARPRMGFTQQMLQQQMEQDQQQFQPQFPQAQFPQAQFQQPQFPQAQFQQQQPPQRQVSQQGQPKERIISIRMEGSPPPPSVPQQQQQQQQQQFQQARPRGPAPARQHSTSSQRVIPVQLVAAEDGTPHVSIGGRLIPLTGESVTLPMGLVMAEQDRARLIQQISDMQGGAPQTATSAPPMGAAAPRPRPVMTSTDPAEDLVPCMRSVQLSDGDKQLMSAFKNKVDGETDTYLHSESDPRYKGAHIPSRTFRILQAATGGADGVSGGAPPSNSSRIGGPGQNRTVVVTMPTGGASGPAVPASQQEAPEPKKYTGGNIPSRSFRVLQQMTADDQES